MQLDGNKTYIGAALLALWSLAFLCADGVTFLGWIRPEVFGGGTALIASFTGFSLRHGIAKAQAALDELKKHQR